MRPGSRGGATRHQAACEPPGWLRRALSEVAALGRQTNVAIGSGERTAFVRSSCGSLLPLNPCARLDQYDSGLTRASGETPRLHSTWKQKSRVQRAAAYTRCSPLTLLARCVETIEESLARQAQGILLRVRFRMRRSEKRNSKRNKRDRQRGRVREVNGFAEFCLPSAPTCFLDPSRPPARLFSKDRFVHKAPVRFDDLCIFGG